MRRAVLLLLVVVPLVATACGGGATEAPLLPGSPTTRAQPDGDLAGVAAWPAGIIRNPYENDPVARRDGERLYRQMNCAECHGYQAQGGMCPSLVDAEWLYGGSSADKFASLERGRPKGMPAYGQYLLDEASIWKIVAYLDYLEDEARAAQPGRAGGGAPDEANQRAGPPGAARH
jgi:cytochrome c oxidase cbb3-type subunit III